MMKKIVILLFVVFFVFQTNAQMFKRGDILADTYIGYPNLYKLGIEEYLLGADGDIADMKRLFPLGFRFEFFSEKRIAHSLDFTYVQANCLMYEFKGYYSYYDSINDSYYLVKNFTNYTIKAQKYSLVYSLNFHFIRNSSKWDGYIMAGLGLKYRNASSLDNPDYQFRDYNKIGLISRLGLGFRYFVTPNLGCNFSFKLGGPLLTVGVTAKF